VVIVTPRLQLELLKSASEQLHEAIGNVKHGEVIHVSVPITR
jgi:hypothetical protein